MRNHCFFLLALLSSGPALGPKIQPHKGRYSHMALYQPAVPWWGHCSATQEIPELLVASTTLNTFKFLSKHPELCGTTRLRSNSSSSFSCKIPRKAETLICSFRIFQLRLTSGTGSGTEVDRINFHLWSGNLTFNREMVPREEAGAQPCPYC